MSPPNAAEFIYRTRSAVPVAVTNCISFDQNSQLYQILSPYIKTGEFSVVRRPMKHVRAAAGTKYVTYLSLPSPGELPQRARLGKAAKPANAANKASPADSK